MKASHEVRVVLTVSVELDEAETRALHHIAQYDPAEVMRLLGVGSMTRDALKQGLTSLRAKLEGPIRAVNHARNTLYTSTPESKA